MRRKLLIRLVIQPSPVRLSRLPQLNTFAMLPAIVE